MRPNALGDSVADPLVPSLAETVFLERCPFPLHLLKSQIHGFGRFIGVFAFAGFQAFRDEADTARNLEAGLPLALVGRDFRISSAENDEITVI